MEQMQCPLIHYRVLVVQNNVIYMDTVKEFFTNKNLEYTMKIRVYKIMIMVQVVVVIFVFVY